MSIVDCVGTSSVLWYGKEGLHEVIVLEYLGDSLGNLINERRLNREEVFSYASQMVYSFSIKMTMTSLNSFARTALSDCVAT